jgi:muramidase (phage lysozyme)
MPNTRYEENLQLLSNPKVQNMLTVIKHAEGTNNAKGYNTRVGYTYFDDLSHKPKGKVYIPAIRDYSSAEGAYQFLDSTWDGLAKKLNLSDFSKKSQDVAAIELLRESGALSELLNDNFEGAVHKAAPVWASLPKPGGGSVYANQKSKRLDSLKGVYFGGDSESRYDYADGVTSSLTTIPYEQLSPEQIAALKGYISGIPQENEGVSKAEIKALEAKEALSQKQAEKQFLEDLNSAYTQAQTRQPQPQSQAPAYGGQAYTLQQLPLPEYQPIQTQSIQFQRGGEVTEQRKDTASSSMAGVVDFIDSAMRPAVSSIAAFSEAFFPEKFDKVKEKIFETYRPVSYPGLTEGITQATKKFPPRRDADGDYEVGEEAWRKALNLPVKSKYIVPSKYKPSNAKDPDAQYYTLKGIVDPAKIKEYVSMEEPNEKGIYQVESLAPFIKKDFMDKEKFSNIDPLQGFQLHIGKDKKTGRKYVSLYDKYNFDFPMANSMIKPYEFYDRFYYEDSKKSKAKPKKEFGGYFQHGGEQAPSRVQFDMRDPLDYGVMTEGDLSLSAGLNMNLENPHTRVGINYDRGNFDAGLEYRRGIHGDKEYSANLGYSTPTIGASLGYNSAPYGSNIEGRLNYRNRNLSTAVDYEHSKDNPSLGLMAGYNKGRFRAHGTLRKDRDLGNNVNVGATYTFQDGGIQTIPLTREELKAANLARIAEAKAVADALRAERSATYNTQKEVNQGLRDANVAAQQAATTKTMLAAGFNPEDPKSVKEYWKWQKSRSSGEDQIYDDAMGIDERWKRKKGCNIATDSETKASDYKQDGGYIRSDLDYGNILNNLRSFQSGGTVSAIYEQMTGKPWATAKKEGLTDGSYQANIELRGNLLRGSLPNAKAPINPEVSQPTFGTRVEGPSNSEELKVAATTRPTIRIAAARQDSKPASSSPVAMLTRDEYLDKVDKVDYLEYMKKNPNTPYYKDSGVNTEESGKNCIHGVCTVLKNSIGFQFQNKSGYTGNQSFEANLSKEGFYRADPFKEGFKKGDVLQLTKPKTEVDEYEKHKKDPVKWAKMNKEDVPYHAKFIAEERVSRDGQKEFLVVHNRGKDVLAPPQWYTEKELLSHIKQKGNNHSMHVNRYDPEMVSNIQKDKIAQDEVFKGNTKYSKHYDKPLNVKDLDTSKLGPSGIADAALHPIESMKTAPKIQMAKDLLNIYKKNYQKIGKTANVSPEVLNKIFEYQVGIANQESDLGSDMGYKVKSAFPGLITPETRKIKEQVSKRVGINQSDWTKDYWNKNANSVKTKYKTYDEFKEYLDKDERLSPEDRELLRVTAPQSKGVFQQKELSKRGKLYGADFNSLEGQFLGSIGLQIDNFHTLKKKYPSMNDDQLAELSVLMHNAPKKALTPEFVDYYFKNNDVDYINSVKNKKISLIPNNTNKLKTKIVRR